MTKLSFKRSPRVGIGKQRKQCNRHRLPTKHVLIFRTTYDLVVIIDPAELAEVQSFPRIEGVSEKIDRYSGVSPLGRRRAGIRSRGSDKERNPEVPKKKLNSVQ